MNVYVNRDDELSLCVVSAERQDFLVNENLADHYEVSDVPQEVIDNYNSYSFVEGSFIETAIYGPTVIPLSDTQVP